jgi:hypothetical protein
MGLNLLRLKLILKSQNSINHQVFIKFWQNSFKQEVIHYFLRSTNLLILFGIRKNCHSSGRNLFLCLFIKRVIKLNVAIIKEYHCYQLHTKGYPIFFSQG